jgi:hypothetical protein
MLAVLTEKEDPTGESRAREAENRNKEQLVKLHLGYRPPSRPGRDSS